MEVDITGEFELERLRAEIQQEKQMKEMLDHSVDELRVTLDELEKRCETIDDEGNEWKTRFESQEEINQQLQQQILTLQNKTEDAKANLKDASRASQNQKTIHKIDEVTPLMIRTLEKDIHSLNSQLRDLEWRLDQESKAYHKANDERKQLVIEINLAKSNIEDLKMRQRIDMRNTPRSKEKFSSIQQDLDRNIPDNQRILDTRHGPIKRTAGIRNLPRLGEL